MWVIHGLALVSVVVGVGFVRVRVDRFILSGFWGLRLGFDSIKGPG